MGSGQSIVDRPKAIDNPQRVGEPTPVMISKPRRPRMVLVTGLDNSGKTTLMEQFARDAEDTGGVEETTSTIGLGYKFLPRYSLQMFEAAGGKAFRSQWDEHMQNKHAIIFCIDLTERDPSRIAMIREWHATVTRHVQNNPHVVFTTIGTKFDVLCSDEYDWASVGVKIDRAINCQNCRMCQAFLKELSTRIESVVYEYEKPVPVAKVVEKPASDASNTSVSLCKWLW